MEISLYPNTGHHYIFLPFGEGAQPGNRNLEEVREATAYGFNSVPKHVTEWCLKETDSWTRYDASWGPYEGMYDKDGVHDQSGVVEWIRWRFGSKNYDRNGVPLLTPLHGVWVSIETNLGDVTRGCMVDDPIPDGTLAEEGEQPTPFFKRDLTDLPDHEVTLKIPIFAEVKVAKPVVAGSRTNPTNQTDDYEAGMPFSSDDAGTLVAPPPMSALGAVMSPNKSKASTSALPIKLPPRPPELEYGKSSDAPDGMVRVQELQLWWPPRVADENWDVDLVVDFGNSRSVAILLERRVVGESDQKPPLSDIVKPVCVMPRCSELAQYERSKDSDRWIFESWFVLKEPVFQDFQDERNPENVVEQMDCELQEKTTGIWPFITRIPQNICTARIKRVPQIFMEVSPCVMGPEARDDYANMDFSGGLTLAMGSSKRYIWDSDSKVGPYWGMVQKSSKVGKSRMNPLLAGLMLNFIPETCEWTDDMEVEWPVDEAPIRRDGFTKPVTHPATPNYPRAETMVWSALAILEAAYRQISASANLQGAAGFMRRNFRSVSVTYPSGWSPTEQRIYRRKWQTAINIFAHTHLADPIFSVPTLNLDCDEALASQLPIIYSEIKDLGNVGSNWLSLNGRLSSDPDAGKRHVVRVMSLDIGGGTTDYSILEYDDTQGGVGVALKSELLYKDSSSQAGDVLVQKIIENVLLPSLGDKFVSSSDKQKFASFLGSRKDTDTHQERWKRIVRLVLVAKVQGWLKNWSQGNDSKEVLSEFDQQLLPIAYRIDDKIRQELVEMAEGAGIPNLWGSAEVIKYTHAQLKEVVRLVFQPLFESLADLIAVFGVDLVIVSGKPSELPGIRELLIECFPLMPTKIIAARDHVVEDWYPFREQTTGKIADAKTVTVTGAALYRAISSMMVDHWQPIEHSATQSLSGKNCWLQFAPRSVPHYLLLPPYLDNGSVSQLEEVSKKINLPVNTRIGRCLMPSANLRSEPVYIFRWRNRELGAKWGLPSFKITLARVPAEPDDQGRILEGEGLRVQSFEETEIFAHRGQADQDSMVINEDNFQDYLELKLCTIEGDAHWMEIGQFEVNWGAYHATS